MLRLGDYLLTCAAEECNEVAQRISKAIRFGLDEVQAGQTLTNRERIIAEYNDLIAVMRLMGLHEEDPAAQLKKVEKIAKYQRYAQERGTLEKSA